MSRGIMGVCGGVLNGRLLSLFLFYFLARTPLFFTTASAFYIFIDEHIIDIPHPLGISLFLNLQDESLRRPA